MARFTPYVPAIGALPWLLRLRGPYHFDDWVTPMSDPASAGLRAFAKHLFVTLRPLSKLTYALEASMGLGELAPARRLVSVVMLAFAATSLSRILRLLGARKVVAITLAAVWACHPVHAESVLSLSGRPAMLGCALSLAALGAALRRRWRRAGVVLLLACLARETAIAMAVPIAFVAWTTTPGRPRSQLLTRVEPALTATLLVGAWLLVQPRYRSLADYSLHARPFAHSVIAQISAIPIGLSLYVRTWALTIDHGEAFAREVTDARFLGGLSLYGVAIAVVLGALVRARHRALGVGASLWLAAILPTQSVLARVDPLAERALPLALAGLLVALAAGLARPVAARVALGLSLLSAPILVLATLSRGALYASDLALWRQAASRTVVNSRPWVNYASALLAEGRREEALVAARAARVIDPSDAAIEALVDTLEAGRR